MYWRITSVQRIFFFRFSLLRFCSLAVFLHTITSDYFCIWKSAISRLPSGRWVNGRCKIHKHTDTFHFFLSAFSVSHRLDFILCNVISCVFLCFPPIFVFAASKKKCREMIISKRVLVLCRKCKIVCAFCRASSNKRNT